MNQEKITELLNQAREHVRLNPPTQADKDEHAISWVLGNLNASTNHHTTREVVAAQYYKLQAEQLQAQMNEAPSKLRCDDCNNTLATVGLYIQPRADIHVLCDECWNNQKYEGMEREG